MWRDPLDELIDELDEKLPAVSAPSHTDWQAVLFGCQLCVGPILRRQLQDVQRVMQDPHVKAYLAWMEKLSSVPADSADRSPGKRTQALDSKVQ